MKRILLILIFLQSAVATLGSLYFSEVLHYVPCTLCWYQRICMYPIAVISLVGLIVKDKRVFLYILPLSIIGLVISTYHNMLVYNIISENIVTCTAGVPCSVTYAKWFGFLTIPLLSLTAFLVINILTILYICRDKNSK